MDAKRDHKAYKELGFTEYKSDWSDTLYKRRKDQLQILVWTEN